MKRKIYSELPEWKQKYSTKETLTEKYKSALRQYVGDSEQLELFLERNGFYTKRCSSHDHWRGGLLQHSWRVYQYMLFLREHPELLKDKPYADEVGRLSEREVALAGLLHDVGKTVHRGSEYHDGHESRSEQILSKLVVDGDESWVHVKAAIYYHHHRAKDHEVYRTFKNCALAALLRYADGAAAGTTWNSTRFVEGRSQKRGEVCTREHLHRQALDRTIQMLKNRMYLDRSFCLHATKGYGRSRIQWGVHSEIAKDIEGLRKHAVVCDAGTDVISAAHQLAEAGGERMCLVMPLEGIARLHTERDLQSRAKAMGRLMVCSNLVQTFFKTEDAHNHRYVLTTVDEIASHVNQEKACAYLESVTMMRDGESYGYRQVAPWSLDVLLVADKKFAEFLVPASAICGSSPI